MSVVCHNCTFVADQFSVNVCNNFLSLNDTEFVQLGLINKSGEVVVG